MKYRKTNVRKWTDDIHMSMSPEQKLIFDWLNTNPYTKMCGIHPISFATMARQVGIVEQNVRNAFEAMCKQFPNVIAFDPMTLEYFMPSWLNENAASSSPKITKPICEQLEEVQSIDLLRLLNERTPESRRIVKKTIQNRLRSLTQIENGQKQRGISKVFESEPLMIPLGGRTKELKNLRTKELNKSELLANCEFAVCEEKEELKLTETEVRDIQQGKYTVDDVKEFEHLNNQKTETLIVAKKSNRDIFENVEGLSQKIGRKHYGILNEAAKDKAIYDTLQDFWLDGKFELLTDWLEYKKEIRKGYKHERGLKVLINKFKEFTYLEWKDAYEASVSNGWQSINPKKNTKERKQLRAQYDANIAALTPQLRNKRAAV